MQERVISEFRPSLLAAVHIVLSGVSLYSDLTQALHLVCDAVVQETTSSLTFILHRQKNFRDVGVIKLASKRTWWWAGLVQFRVDS